MGTARRREREARERRRSILDAARRLFWEHGYAGTTVPQIAREAELATGTIYLHFPSKEAIYAQLLAEGYEQLRLRLEQAVGESGEPLAAARALTDAFFDFARRNPVYFDMIFFRLQREGGGGWQYRFPPERTGGLADRMNACKAVAARVLERLDPRAGSETIRTRVEAIWSMLSGVLFYFQQHESYRDVAEEATRLVLRAIEPPRGRGESDKGERGAP